MVFLRLAEDVLLLQTVPNQRRRDIMTALTSSMPNLFAYFLNTLQSTYQAYISLVNYFCCYDLIIHLTILKTLCSQQKHKTFV